MADLSFRIESSDLKLDAHAIPFKLVIENGDSEQDLQTTKSRSQKNGSARSASSGDARLVRGAAKAQLDLTLLDADDSGPATESQQLKLSLKLNELAQKSAKNQETQSLRASRSSPSPGPKPHSRLSTPNRTTSPNLSQSNSPSHKLSPRLLTDSSESSPRRKPSNSQPKKQASDPARGRLTESAKISPLIPVILQQSAPSSLPAEKERNKKDDRRSTLLPSPQKQTASFERGRSKSVSTPQRSPQPQTGSSIQERARLFKESEPAVDAWDWDSGLQWEDEASTTTVEEQETIRSGNNSPVFPILSDPDLKPLFSQYLEPKPCFIALQAYDAVCTHRALTNQTQIEESATLIWSNYLTDGSPKKLNCPPSVMKTITTQSNPPTQYTFDGIIDLASEILSAQLPGFMSSELYTNHQANSNSRRVEMGGFKPHDDKPLLMVGIVSPKELSPEPRQPKPAKKKKRERAKSETPSTRSGPSRQLQQGTVSRWTGSVWKKNFMVLEVSTVTVYKKDTVLLQQDFKPGASIITLTKHQGKDSCWTVIIPPNEPLTFAAGSIFESSQWIRNFRTAISHAKEA